MRDNKTIHYLSNRFLAESETNRGTSHELQQTMRTSQFTAKNFFSLIRNGEKSTWKFNSATQYAYLPSSLSLHDGKDKFIQHSLYNDNKASHLRKHNGFTRQYTAGIKGEWASVKHHSTRMETFGASSFSPTSPLLPVEQGKWQGSLSLPLSYKRYFSQQRSFLFQSVALSALISRTTIGKFPSTAVYTAQQEMSQTSALLPIGQTTVPGKH